MTAIDLGDVDGARLRRALNRGGLGTAIVLHDYSRILASRDAPVRLVVIAEVAADLDARDRAELATLLLEAATAFDDEAAWRPLVRARRLLERAGVRARENK